MRTIEENGVGRFFVEAELANNDDMAAVRRLYPRDPDFVVSEAE